MTNKEMDFAKEIFGKILDLNKRDDGIIYQPRVGLHIGGGYLISCYLKEGMMVEGEFVFPSSDYGEEFFDAIDRCAKRLLEDADVNKISRIKKLEEELACLKE